MRPKAVARYALPSQSVKSRKYWCVMYCFGKAQRPAASSWPDLSRERELGRFGLWIWCLHRSP